MAGCPTDLAVSIADGVEIISGIDMLGESEELYDPGRVGVDDVAGAG